MSTNAAEDAKRPFFKALRMTSGPTPEGSPMVMPMRVEPLAADFDIGLFTQFIDPFLELLLEYLIVQPVVDVVPGLDQRCLAPGRNAGRFENIDPGLNFHGPGDLVQFKAENDFLDRR